MALVACRECGETVSDQAVRCPKCGVALRKPRRSVMGRLAKWSFVAFNLLMVLWIAAALSQAPEHMRGLTEAERAGAEIGTGVGVMILVALWVAGDFILGLFTLLTRPRG